MDDPTWWIDALLAPQGRALLARLAHEPLGPDHELRLIPKLRAEYPAELVTAALTQASLRLRAVSKFSHAGSMLFTKAGLEQASSERMARHHAARYAPFTHVTDLCTGIGGDLIALGCGRQALGVDLDPVHARLAAVNAEVNGLGANVTTLCADVTALTLDDRSAVFVDPARRSDARRYKPGESDPPLGWCYGLAERGMAVGIKAAPGIATEVAPADWELEFVSEGRELKASVLWSPRLATAKRRATLLPERLTLTDSQAEDGRSSPRLPVRPPGAFIIDPDPAVTRAGLVEGLGASLGDCWKIDDQIAFLSADAELRTPFGRTLRVEHSAPWNLNALKVALRGLDVGVVDIRKRGSAVDVEEVQRRLRLTGVRAAVVVLTRAANDPWMLVCSALDDLACRRV